MEFNIHFPVSMRKYTRCSAIADKPPDGCVRRKLPPSEWLRFIGRIFLLLPTPLPCDAVNRPEPPGFIFGMGRMSGLQSVEGRMMIDLSRLGTIHQRDRQNS